MPKFFHRSLPEEKTVPVKRNWGKWIEKFLLAVGITLILFAVGLFINERADVLFFTLLHPMEVRATKEVFYLFQDEANQKFIKTVKFNASN